MREVVAPTPAEPRSAAQNSAFHGKCATLAELELGKNANRLELNQRAVAHKQSALAWAGAQLGRAIESSKELSRDEMSEVLDWLDERQVEAALAAIA